MSFAEAELSTESVDDGPGEDAKRAEKETGRPWSTRSPDHAWDYVVVGSGMGGMTTAAMLARLGRRVLVLEQHYVPGGFTHTFRRKRWRWDVGVHAVGGILGALLTGVFNDPALGGPGFVSNWVTGEIVKAADYTIAGQVWTQAKAVGVTILWSGVVAFIAYKVVDLVVGLRVSEEDEREGLDIASHGESAYRM